MQCPNCARLLPKRLNAFPQFPQLNSRPACGTKDVQPFRSPEDHPLSWHLLQAFGAIPSALDRHVTEFFPQMFGDGAYYGKTLGKDIFSFEGTIAHGDKHYAEMRTYAESTAPLPAEYLERFEGEHERVIDIIESIRSERGMVYSAEILPTLDRCPICRWLQSSNRPPLPMRAASDSATRAVTALAGALATRYQWVECIVEAALEHNREKFIQALVLDGAVNSFQQAATLADELLAVQQPYLQW